MVSANYISLDTAKNTIITALEQFDTELARRGVEILFNDNRLNITQVTHAETSMMMCRPAGITMEDLKAANMYMPSFVQKFGPHFTKQDNPTDHAIIDFEYDGSPRAIIWLAHELGHAIADDVQRENGLSFRDFTNTEMEEQAYFVQSIISKHLKDSAIDIALNDDDLGQNTLTMSWERAAQFTNAGNNFHNALSAPVEQRTELTLNALGKKVNTGVQVTTLPSHS